MLFLVLLVAELADVEADVLEHVLQLGDVRFFDGVQDLVDALAVARLVAPLVQAVEIGAGEVFGLVATQIDLRQVEALVAQHLLEQFGLVAVFLLVRIVVVLPHIRDVLEEEHGQDEVLVDAGIYGATEAVAGVPDGLVDLVLQVAWGFVHRLLLTVPVSPTAR
jgi:hypothetical protein